MSDQKPIPRVNGKLPTFAEARALKAQEKVEKVVATIFYHFNKHEVLPIEAAYILAGSYQMVLKQQPPEEQKAFDEMFKKLLEKDSDGKKIITN